MSSDYSLSEDPPNINPSLIGTGSGAGTGTGTPTGNNNAGMNGINATRTVGGIFRGTATECEPLLPNILSYVTILELLNMQAVSRRYKTLVSLCFASTRVLNLCQFWSCLGVIPDTHFTSLVSQFHSCRFLSLAYCQHLTDTLLHKIITHVPNVGATTRLDLFYCYNLTDASVSLIINTFPLLERLNLGRCNNLSDRAIQSLGDMKYLKTLNVVYNPSITEDLLMLMEDPSKFPSLTLLNIANSGGGNIRQETVSDLESSRPSLRIRGPQQEFTFDKQGKRVRVDRDKERDKMEKEREKVIHGVTPTAAATTIQAQQIPVAAVPVTVTPAATTTTTTTTATPSSTASQATASQATSTQAATAPPVATSTPSSTLPAASPTPPASIPASSPTPTSASALAPAPAPASAPIPSPSPSFL